MPISPVLQALRDATAALHTAIETDADVEARLRDIRTRPDMVARFHRLHSAVEVAIAPWRPAFVALGHEPDRRAPLIERGLKCFGVSTPEDASVTPLATFGEAVGWVYVAEGSMLGGRVMQRGMIRDGIPLTGLDFLDPWGDETGSRWRALMSAMDSACASGRATQADIVKGGQDAFHLAFSLLVPPARLKSA